MYRASTFALLIVSLAGCGSAPQASAPPATEVVAVAPVAVDPAPASPELAVTVPVFANTTCPIMGKPVSVLLFAETEKGRIYMCCKACTKQIQADVAKAHQTAYPVVKKLDTKVCPVTGGDVFADSPTVVVQGFEIPLCCDGCQGDVTANSQIMLAKATNPAIVDLQNENCPITGEPVVNDAFCLVGDSLVRLSSPQCVEEVRKDPAKALATAKGG